MCTVLLMKKVCLIIIDGFGVAEPGPGNARHLANMPFLETLQKTVPHCLLDAAGEAVGLPPGEMGNSESGHQTIGAGRVCWQPLARINRAISSGEFYKNPVLVKACKQAAEKGVMLHLMGLYSSGGIHSHLDHFHAMIKLARDTGVKDVRLHLFSDARDVPERHFCIDYDLLKAELKDNAFAKVASLVGRFYMDRDHNWETRTKVAYDLFTKGEGTEVDDLCKGVEQWYVKAPEKEDTDYYLEPLKTSDYEPMKEGDVVVAVDFRSDRMVQIVQALEAEEFDIFDRPIRIADVYCMGPHAEHLPVAFPPEDASGNLGETISKAGLKQFRIAETDKMPHVTFFFSGLRHEPYEGEDRLLVESPKVPNYADTPEMSADRLTKELIKRVEGEQYEFIVANFANPDLVGHGGKLDAAIVACETVDRNLAILIPKLEKHGYDWIITADHGNAECMLYDDGSACPTHTANQVETFVHSDCITKEHLDTCTGLTDIAPLCLTILGLEIPKKMRGKDG